MTSSLPSPDPNSMTDSCPFNSLHPNVEWEILKQLDFHDYKNLAFTCHKWFHVASTAPDSVKPNLSFERICLDSNGISYNISIWGDWKRLFHIPHTKFTHLALVKKIDVDSFEVERQKSDESHEAMFCQVMELLTSHISRVEVGNVFIDMPMTFIKGNPYVDRLIDLSPNLWITRRFKQKNQRERFRWFFKDYLFSQKHLSLAHCNNIFPVDLDIVNSFLKECVRGERPKLLTFISQVYNRKDSWRLITAGLGEQLEDIEEKTTIFNERAICAKLVIAGSKLVLYHRPKYVLLRKEGHLCDRCDVEEDKFI